ncbi:MAG TPA: hypothetical protein VHQ22_04295 [Terriglobales bacterium]|nr:hypothetical protein [Terriglobales bacterium]
MSSSVVVTKQQPEPAAAQEWSTQRKHLVKVALWLAMVTATLLLAGFLLEHATSRFDFSEPKLTESLQFSKTQLDVAFFGDSLTLEGVNPDVIDQRLHTRSYNFALGGASIMESEMQLRNFLRHNPKPRMVGLGIYLNIPNKPPGARATLYFGLPGDLKAQYRDELLQYEGIKIDRSFITFNLVPAYRYRNVIDLVLKSLLSKDNQRPTFVKGQAQVTFFREPYLGRAHESVFKTDELESFIRFCEEEQIPLLLFEPPNHPGYSELTSNRAALLNALSHLLARHPGVRFISYNNSTFTLARKDWVNLNHLNAAGSAKFSAVLSDTVSQGIAGGHR